MPINFAFRYSVIRDAVLAAILLVAWPAIHFGDDGIAQVLQPFQQFDLDQDGTSEIQSLVPITSIPRCEIKEQDRLVVVFVESRLLTNAEKSPSSPLKAVLTEYQSQLEREGWSPLMLEASVYAGEVHQDGRTVLAMRRVLQSLQKAFPKLAGAVLVGSFPESMLSRRWAWKHDDRPVTFGKTTYNGGKGTPRATWLAMDPEIVAHRSDIVLSDLDGNWEEIYRQPPTDVEYIKFLPEDVEGRQWPDRSIPMTSSQFSVTTKRLEDFFFIDDADYEIVDQSESRMTLRCSYEMRRPETTAADRELPNPMARPEIHISRINPLHVAVVQPKENLDEKGQPRSVSATDPSPNTQFKRDPDLEQRLLVEYFQRNLSHRRGKLAPDSKRVATLTTDLLTPSPDYFAGINAKLGKPVSFPRANTVDFVRFIKTPAIVKGVSAHSEPGCSILMNGYNANELQTELGGNNWHWQLKDGLYEPSVSEKSIRNKAHFSLLRTLWENKKIAEAGGCFYIHGGCEVNSPHGAANFPYNAERYCDHTQMAESLLFYGNGIALIGRSKVFYDIPSGIDESFGSENGTFGDLLSRYFEDESRDAHLSRRVADRNKAHFWSILGDWTLKLKAAPSTTNE
jgi:hypothetical protein